VAARANETVVNMSHFEQAIDRVIGGLEKKNKVRLVMCWPTSAAAELGWVSDLCVHVFLEALGCCFPFMCCGACRHYEVSRLHLSYFPVPVRVFSP
jgi:hypothetical protein